MSVQDRPSVAAELTYTKRVSRALVDRYPDLPSEVVMFLEDTIPQLLDRTGALVGSYTFTTARPEL